jgi:ParB family transcriptional regulator, chromosome partitioning protein
MSIKPKGLGRGLDALLGGGKADAPNSAPPKADVLRDLPPSQLKPGKYQPRTQMDQAALQELAASITQRGIVQPILVREIGKQQFEIIAGERRWRAAQIAGLQTVPVLVREIADEAALGIGLIENIQRENLNAMEEAAGIARLIEEFKLTHDEAAQAVSRSRSAVTNLLRLLELAKPVQDMVMHGKLDMGHARALLALNKSAQVEIAHQTISKQLSVRDTEALVRRELTAPNVSASKTKNITQDLDIRQLENELSEKLSTVVSIKANKKGKGEVTLQFHNIEALDGLLAVLRQTVSTKS